MRYQRVVYTQKLTADLRAKMRIISYAKAKGKKKNVYFVKFASCADMVYAERIAAQIGGITMKPVQPLWGANQTQYRSDNSFSDSSVSSSSSTTTKASNVSSCPSTASSSLSSCRSTSNSSVSSYCSTSTSKISLCSASPSPAPGYSSTPIPNVSSHAASLKTISLYSSTPKSNASSCSASPMVISSGASTPTTVFSTSTLSFKDPSETNTPKSVSSPLSPSGSSYLAALTNLTFLSDDESTVKQPERTKVERQEETLEHRVDRLLGRHPEVARIQERKVGRQPPKAPNFHDRIEHNTNCIEQYENEKKQILKNLRSCLKVMEIARKAADNFLKIYQCGKNYDSSLEYFYNMHSSAFYMKGTVSHLIKNAYTQGLRVWWTDVSAIVDELDDDIAYQQKFIGQTSALQLICSQIDNTTSIAMTSKLAYQLSKLST